MNYNPLIIAQIEMISKGEQDSMTTIAIGRARNHTKVLVGIQLILGSRKRQQRTKVVIVGGLHCRDIAMSHIARIAQIGASP